MDEEEEEDKNEDEIGLHLLQIQLYPPTPNMTAFVTNTTGFAPKYDCTCPQYNTFWSNMTLKTSLFAKNTSVSPFLNTSVLAQTMIVMVPHMVLIASSGKYCCICPKYDCIGPQIQLYLPQIWLNLAQIPLYVPKIKLYLP